MSRFFSKKRKTSTGKIYVALIMLFIIGIMGFQIYTLYRKNLEYAATEEGLQNQLDAANDTRDELAEYEEYVGSDEYVEDQARSKLGLTKSDEIIFREAED